eukprot:2562169-Pleurochrysis_carterae.AAC.3
MLTAVGGASVEARKFRFPNRRMHAIDRYEVDEQAHAHAQHEGSCDHVPTPMSGRANACTKTRRLVARPLPAPLLIGWRAIIIFSGDGSASGDTPIGELKLPPGWWVLPSVQTLLSLSHTHAHTLPPFSRFLQPYTLPCS